MTERDYAIRSFKEVTLNAARHTEERMNLYYGKIKELMNNYQDLILENQLVRYMGYYFFEIVVPQSANKRYKPSFPETEE